MPTIIESLARGGTLLFQGDSITDAFRKPEELNDCYRLGMGYAFIAGSCLRATLGRADLAVHNRGISGHTCAALRDRWLRDCIELRPDVLSILVGINDCLYAGERSDAAVVEGFSAAHGELLRQVRDALPTCRIVLLEPFFLPVQGSNPRVPGLCAQLRAVVRAAATRHGAVLVELQDAFTAIAGDHPERWSYDGIHPNANGQWLIAQRWLAAAGLALPAAKPMAV
jgi:lysophospholipase L1-like esterase